METVENIFNYGNLEQTNIIKSVQVDWKHHTHGIMNLIRAKEPNYKLTDTHKEILNYLLQYFTGSNKFPDSLNKGLWVVGNVGSGKTLLFEVFKQYTGEVIRNNSFNYYTANEIISNCETTGTEFLKQFSDNMENNKPYPRTLYIDDCFSGSDKINHYGTVKNVIEQVIELRYNVFKRYRKLTHISTNVLPGDVADLFVDSDRLSSRMEEMFNKIKLDSNDWRTFK